MGFWLTSDTHFGHTNIIKYAGRPFTTVEEMDDVLISNWNAVVGKRDIVWHLGDFAYRNAEGVLQYKQRLNGRIHILRGNHDNPNHLRWVFGEGRVFDVRDVGFNGQRIFLSHYAHRVWPASHKGSFHAYGHSHNGLDKTYGRWGRSKDVGVDACMYKPVHISAFIEELLNETFTLHHPDT